MDSDSDNNTPHRLEAILGQANAARDARRWQEACYHFAKASELLFEQAKSTVVMDEKRALICRAKTLLETAVRLRESLKSNCTNGSPCSSHKVNSALHSCSESIVTPASAWKVTEIPEIRLDDVAGLEDVKRALYDDVINVMVHPGIYERFQIAGGGGVLMYGPPGTGKTYIAKAVAGELNAPFFAVDASLIKDKYVGETEKNMRRLFEAASRFDRAVLFFDEVDALLSRRADQKVDLVSQFLILADGIRKSPAELLLLGATNKPWAIDPAALRPGRFGRQIHVGLPDAAARRSILEYCIRDVPVSGDFNIDEAVRGTEGFSGADMAELCSRAKKSAARRQMELGIEQCIGIDDFRGALEQVQISVSPETLQAFEEWQHDRTRMIR